MKRVSDNRKKIVVRFDQKDVIQSKFGFAVVLDPVNVVFVKKWQVESNWHTELTKEVEVLLDSSYFKVKKRSNSLNGFSDDPERLTFSFWINRAEDLEEETPVFWQGRLMCHL